MEQKTIIEEFRKLEEELGSQKAQLIMDFTMKYTELLTRNLPTKDDLQSVKDDLHSVEVGLRKEISNMSWKLAGFLIAQAAVIVTLIKLLGSQ